VIPASRGDRMRQGTACGPHASIRSAVSFHSATSIFGGGVGRT
jgi:hypothetical protein